MPYRRRRCSTRRCGTRRVGGTYRRRTGYRRRRTRTGGKFLRKLGQIGRHAIDIGTGAAQIYNDNRDAFRQVYNAGRNALALFKKG